MPLKTVCPRCDVDGSLVLLGARVYPHNDIPIHRDGFVITGSFNTEEETVKCKCCEWSGDLQYEDDEGDVE